MDFEIKHIKHGIWILPTIGIGNKKYYYGYPVISITIVWLAWQIFFVFGVKKWRNGIE